MRELEVRRLGVIPYAYYQPHASKMKALGIDGGKGPVLPSEKTVVDGTYSPMSRPLFVYINTKAIDRAEVKEFLDFYLKSQALIKEVKYVPLPDKAYEAGLARANAMKTGSVFGGKEAVGITIEELFERELKQ